MTRRQVSYAGIGGGQVRRIVVGVDDSRSGLAALRRAVTLAAAEHVPLVAVRAWALGLPRHGGRRNRHLSHPHVVLSFSGDEQELAARVLTHSALLSAVGDLPAGVDVQIQTPAADPAVALTELAEPGDVLVVGSDPEVRLRSLVHGSVSRYCVRHARCPVLVIQPDSRDARGSSLPPTSAGIPRPT